MKCNRKKVNTFLYTTSAIMIVWLFLLAILLYGYSEYIFMSHPLLMPNDQISYEIESPYFQGSLNAYHELIASHSIRRGGMSKPQLFFRREKEVLELFLKDIEEHGVNPDGCDAFVPSYIYSLYESLGDWEGASNFLLFAKESYPVDSFEHELIKNLAAAVQTRLEEPGHILLMRRYWRSFDKLIQWYAFELFLTLLFAGLVFSVYGTFKIYKYVRG